MDGLFTVFGLGTAFGVFCSWMYDVIRQRSQPVARVAGFESFHGDNVLPAPEPITRDGFSEPTVVGSEHALNIAGATDVQFDVSDVPFSDTLAFDSTDSDLHAVNGEWTPSKPGTPRVVLLLNKNVVREVREKEFPELMQEFGILIDSEQANAFQNGEAVTVGRDTIQLSQV